MAAPKHDVNHDPESHPSAWLGFGKFLVLLCMAALVFLLVQDMVHHHFFTGGYQNYRMGGGW